MLQLNSIFKAMGCKGEIKIYHNCKEEGVKAIKAGYKIICELEDKYSRYLESSLISKINCFAGIKKVAIDTETAKLLELSFNLNTCSNGLFDITSGILNKAWNCELKAPPKVADLEPLLSLVGMDKISFDGSHIFLKCKNMQIDFGGIVKEYCVDKVVNKLLELGISSGLVNLGGDVKVFGNREFNVGIANPETPTQPITVVKATNESVVTSGDYERYYKIAGIKYSHLINPKTGYPVIGARSITVKGKSCLVAGATATIAALHEGNSCIEYLKNNCDDYVVVLRDGKIFVATQHSAKNHCRFDFF